MADDKIEIQITLDDGSVRKGFATIQSEADKTGKKIGDSFGGGAGGIGQLKTAFVGLAAAIGALKIAGELKSFLSESVSAASQQNDAVARLNTSLALTGQLLPGVSGRLQEYASSLQKTTKFGDEAILESSALIQSLAGLSEGGLKRATKASLDLSTALGIDLNTASSLVAKGATGAVESFSRYGIQVKKGATESETLSNLLTQLEKKFGGASEAAANTYSGAIQNLTNNYGDLKEQIGFTISQSPAIVAAIKTVSKIIAELGESLKKAFGKEDLFKGFIIQLIEVVQVATKAGEVLGNIFSTALSILKTGAQAVLQVFLEVFGFIADVAEKFGLKNKFTEALVSLRDNGREILTEFANNSREQLTTAFDTPFADTFNTKLEEVKVAVQSTSGVMTELGDNGIKNIVTPIREELLPTLEDARAAFVSVFTTPDGTSVAQLTADQIAALRDQVTKDFKTIALSARDSLGRGVGSGFAAFGKALAEGENGLKAFTNAFISAIGQAAVSLGTELVLRGIAYSFTPGLQSFGPPLIAAGGALAAFGGFLSAKGGGGSGVGASGGGGGGGGVGNIPAGDTGTFAQAEPEKQTQVKIDVQGTVLDPISVGQQIAGILQDTFNATGTKVVTT